MIFKVKLLFLLKYLMNMEIIKGKSLEKLPFQDDLIRVGDLVYFEGPLLTLFEDSKSDDLYLYDWADRNGEYNRWLIYLATPELLWKFIQQNISYQNFLYTAINKGFYIVDVNRNLEHHHTKFVEYKDLPAAYQPNEKSYFDEADTAHFNKIKNFINKYLQKNSVQSSSRLANN